MTRRDRLVGAGRVALLAAALALSALAYRDHFNPHLPAWRWLGQLLGGCALLTVALGDGRDAGERRWRTWARHAAAAVVLVAAALAAVWIPQPGREIAAAAAVLLAAVAFAASRWRRFRARERACLTAPPPAPAPKMATRLRQVALALIAAGLGLAATYYNQTRHLDAFLLWFASLVVFALAAWRRTRVPASPDAACPWQHECGPQLSARSAAFGLLLVLLLAAALRLVLLTDVPAWINEDEGRQGRYSERIWQDGFPDAFGLGWNAFPHLAYMADYIGVQLFGTSNHNLRLATGTIGTLSLIPVFFWARRWWGNVAALLAVFLLAVNGEHIAWSRTALNNIQQVLVAGLMLAAFARVLGTQRALDWVWLGYATGLAFHTYHAAKLFPALLAVVFAVIALGMRGLLRRSLAGAAVGALALVLCVGPLAMTMVQRWDFFYPNVSNRGEVYQLGEAYHAGDVARIRGFVASHVLGCLFSLISVPSARYAIFDPFVAVPFLLGFGWMLWQWRDPRHLTVLVWGIGILVIGGMMTDYPPAKSRMLGFLPVICLVPAVVAGRVRGALFRWLPARADLVATPLLVVWLGAALYSNWYTQFVYRPAYERGVLLTEICRVIDDMPLPGTLYMAGGEVMGEPKVAANDCMIAADPARTFVDLSDDPAIVPIPPSNRGNAVLLLSRHQAPLLSLVRRYYPDASYRVVHDPSGNPILHVFTLSDDVIERQRGLRAVYRTGTRTWATAEATDHFAPPPGAEFPLDATWHGQILVPQTARYAFEAPGGAVRIDDQPEAAGEPRLLPTGWHAIELSATFQSPSDRTALLWRRSDDSSWFAVPRASLNPASAVGLLGRFFGRVIAADAAAPIAADADYARIDQVISFDWYQPFDEPPPPPLAARPSTMEWSGTVTLTGEEPERIRLETTTPARVYLDGRLVLSADGSAAGRVVEADVLGVTGRVPILIRAVRSADDQWEVWTLRLLWRNPGGDWTALRRYRPN